MVAAAIALGAALAVAPATMATAQMLGPQWVQLVAGDSHTCGLKNTGQAFCWGMGSNGQLGDGSTTNRSAATPVQMPSGVQFTEITLGESHTCAIGNDSKAYCWGMGLGGRLGDGTESDRSAPVPVDMPSGVSFRGISGTGHHTCAIGNDSKTYCWGQNSHGQVGDGTTTSRLGPVQVNSPSGVIFTQVAAGYSHTCAIGNDSKTYCWGMGQHGEIGDGSLNGRTSPVPVDVPAGVIFTELAPGGAVHSCALGNDNKTYCWGDNSYAQLGNGNFAIQSRPVSVNMPPGIIFQRLTVSASQTCAMGSDNRPWCWGRFAGMDHPAPVAVDPPSGTSFYRVTAGANHTCALANPYNNAYCWGSGHSGQLGNNQNSGQSAPVEVLEAGQAPPGPGGSRLTRVFAGGSHLCGLDENAKAYCWGQNDSGQLGDGTTTSRQAPTAVNTPSGVTFTQFALGSTHTCATGSDTRTYCWGSGFNGVLGNGSTANVSTPTPVDAPPGVTLTGLSTQGFHTCGLGSNATTYCWGQNAEGQVGDGTTTNRLSPVPVNAPGGVTFTQIAAGHNHTCAIGSDSKVYCWGLGQNGAMGNGGTSNQSAPGLVTLPGGVTFTQVASGQNHSCAIGGDNRTYCWGFNGNSQVGNGNTTSQPIPVPVAVPGGAALTEVAANFNFTCGLGNDSRAYCWGSGWGYQTESSTPVATITMPVPFTRLSVGSALCAQGNDNSAYCWSGYDPPGVILAGGAVAGGDRMVNVIWNDQMTGTQREYMAICRGCGPRAD
ncbi:chromosome condensation regulator RCC1 [Actinoplanes italicus]|uniref:Alpha-tubulin suppressor-like RCC1 family protein n=2 Tax=Actinoplanes italicus TaxID=113567 RepID=A0A2T0KBR0_9ACTN|nr:alpha-tubulin suppressor-like RCC1 family protein [Actinoplanes italicus]GIE34140.1 chromosome condensation regulator RCC1 [Actinoplanes italicus]